MTYDPPEGVVRFTNGTDEIAYKMSHKIEQYNSLSDLEREHTKSVYLRNEEEKRRGVEYVMSKILGFYKECLELGPEYLTRIADEGEVTRGRVEFHRISLTGFRNCTIRTYYRSVSKQTTRGAVRGGDVIGDTSRSVEEEHRCVEAPENSAGKLAVGGVPEKSGCRRIGRGWPIFWRGVVYI
ncbi:hypothetical protein Tco_0295943 [Tanacetum coccineum]